MPRNKLRRRAGEINLRNLSNENYRVSNENQDGDSLVVLILKIYFYKIFNIFIPPMLLFPKNFNYKITLNRSLRQSINRSLN